MRSKKRIEGPGSLRRGATRAGMLVLSVLAALLIAGVFRPAEARRSNITGGGGPYTVFSAQSLSTANTTSDVKVPVGSTEAAAALIDTEGLTGTNTVTLTRLETINSAETTLGYPVPAQVQKEIVVGANGPNSYLIAFTEGIEWFTFMATSSQNVSVTVSVKVVTQ